MKRIIFLLTLCSRFLTAGDEIEGFWKNMNEETGVIQCVIAVYPYNDRYYARIVGTYDGEGKMKDSIYHPVELAPGVAGHPPYCGLDFIWDLEDQGMVYKGKIIDPQKGGIYNSEVWTEGDDLIIRGKLLFFGRNTTWYPVSNADFPKTFKMPDTSRFVPKIPDGD